MTKSKDSRSIRNCTAAPDQPGITSYGQMRGTLTHISPEQTGRINRPVDHRADLYSLGVTFFSMLTGELPFEESDPIALVRAHIARPPERVSSLNPEIPDILSDMVDRLLKKSAEDRYQSAAGLQSDLERILSALTESGTMDYSTPGGLRWSITIPIKNLF